MPIPNVSITTIGAWKVSQPLTLECSITTVNGITSRVDIVWSSNGLELKRIDGANATSVTDQSEIYTVFYDILQLTTSDHGREFQCGMFVNTTPSVMAIGSITLDITGKYNLAYNY